MEKHCVYKTVKFIIQCIYFPNADPRLRRGRTITSATEKGRTLQTALFFLQLIGVGDRLSCIGLCLSFPQRQVVRGDRPVQSCTTESLNTGRLNCHHKHSQGRLFPHGETEQQRKKRYPQNLPLYVKNPQVKLKALNVCVKKIFTK